MCHSTRCLWSARVRVEMCPPAPPAPLFPQEEERQIIIIDVSHVHIQNTNSSRSDDV